MKSDWVFMLRTNCFTSLLSNLQMKHKDEDLMSMKKDIMKLQDVCNRYEEKVSWAFEPWALKRNELTYLVHTVCNKILPQLKLHYHHQVFQLLCWAGISQIIQFHSCLFSASLFNLMYVCSDRFVHVCFINVCDLLFLSFPVFCLSGVSSSLLETWASHES